MGFHNLLCPDLAKGGFQSVTFMPMVCGVRTEATPEKLKLRLAARLGETDGMAVMI